VSHSTATSFTIWLNKAVANTTFVGWVCGGLNPSPEVGHRPKVKVAFIVLN
jgi:hypothetical protein